MLWAMATLGFEDYLDPLKVYLTRYREVLGDTKGSAKAADGPGKRDGMQPTPNMQVFPYFHILLSIVHLFNLKDATVS
nr:nuclear transcription factor Y subunit B-10-like isoform X1 [Ipomoea batatas]